MNLTKERTGGLLGAILADRHVRSCAALLLSLALSLQLLPVSARAAEDTPLSWESFGRVESPMSKGEAAQNTYIFEVSSGTRLMGGAAENVLYFIIGYTSTDGVKRTLVLSPSEDAITNGFAMASAVDNRDTRRSSVEATFGYQTGELDEKAALSSVQTDQMMFTTPATVQSFDKVQVYGRKADGFSDWACQGMRFYRVDTIYGLDMYGWYSSSGYIDFSGEVVAEVVLNGEGNFRWNNSAGMFTIVTYGASGGLGGVYLVNTATKANYESTFGETHVGLKHESQVSNRLVFRIDFADAADAGFESLAGSYSAGAHTKVSSLKFCECAALVIRYTDIYGCVREVSMPLVINAVGQLMEVFGDAEIAGYAQQGDSIAVSAMLPDYESIYSTTLVVGEEKACEAANMSVTDAAMRNPTHRARAAKTKTDGISYNCVAVYRDVSASIALDGATVRYRFEPGTGNPLLYSTASSSSGLNVDADRETVINMQKYRDSMVLAPVDRLEHYLVTISTDSVGNAGTASDIVMQFKYKSMSGKEVESNEYNVRDYVHQFYGEWPGNVEEFAYRYGFRDSGTVQFIIPLQGVKEFTNVSFKVKGSDDWQFCGLTMAMVKNYETRTASWEEISGSNGALLSHLRYDRRVNTQPVCFSIGQIYEKGEERPTDETGTGTLVQDDSEFHQFDGKGRDVSTKEDVNWSELRHFMSYNDALQDLGFTKERCLYKVEVHVAGDKVNDADDDCGSKNLFYFRLIFENGVSGCTLANQQIMGDAFRTGAITPFKISTSQDYGNLTAVQIIPDSQDGNGDIYDKLKIKKIMVTQETSGPMSPTWTAGSDDEDGLGWIGIDYRDPGEFTTNKGARGRSIAELATTYEITESALAVKLLIGITTGPYSQKPGRNENGMLVNVPQDTLTGGMALGYRYIDGDGLFHTIEPSLDVIEAMNNYSARTGVKRRTVDGVTEAVDYTVSDPKYQFREGTTDYFFVTIQDISQLLDITLEIRSSVVTDWSISAINAWLVRGEGSRYINQKGEYDYRYAEGEEPELIASWDRDENLVKPVQVFRTLQNNGIALISNIPFKTNHIELSKDAGAWSSVITREPHSRTDTLNFYLYPGTGEGTADPNDYDLVAALRYTDSETMSAMQISAGTLSKGEDADGRTVFYATGLTVTNLDAISGIDVKTNSLVPIQAPIGYGVLQRVRDGVMIESYRLSGTANADLGASLVINSAKQTTNIQRVLLQVSESAKTQQLSAELSDLAVALHFKTNDISGGEYRSKYVYLTDQDYTTVRAGQVLELDYILGDIAEITGVNLATTGGLDIPLSAIYIANQAPDNTIVQSWGINPAQGDIVPSARRSRQNVTGEVGALTLKLKTAENTSSSSSATQGPVRMTLGYYDEYGVMTTKVYDNIRRYIVSGSGFASGETDVLQLLIPGLTDLRWIELEPWHDTGDAQASWKLESLSAELGFSNGAITKMPDKTIVEGSPLHIGLADVFVAGDMQTLDTKGEAVKPVDEQTEDEADDSNTIYNGQSGTVLLKSGEGIKVNVRISGSNDGFTAKLESFDPATGATGRASLEPTHKYTEARLTELQTSAETALSTGTTTDERTAAQSIIDLIKELQGSEGSYDVTEDGVTFRTPRNFSGGSLYYRLTIASKETAEASITIDLTVNSETDLLDEAVNRLSTAQTNAKLEAAAAAAATSSSSGGGSSSGAGDNTAPSTTEGSESSSSDSSSDSTDSGGDNG